MEALLLFGIIAIMLGSGGNKTKKRETGEEFYSRIYGDDWKIMKPYFKKEELL